MRAIFQKKAKNRAKYLEISAKMYKFEKIFKKGSLMRATIVCVKQLEYALLIVLLLFLVLITFFIVMHRLFILFYLT